MAHPSIPEWDMEKLPDTNPGSAMRYFGVAMRHERGAGEYAFAQASAERVKFQHGEPAERKSEFASPLEAAAAMKSVAQEFGADIVGICAVDPKYVYDGRDNTHKWAIVIGIAMDMDEILQAPRRETNVEYIKAYAAKAHTVRDSDLTMIPFAYAAGLGELGKHGSLINKELGSCFRISVVTTDVPVDIDQPANDGIDDICVNCNMCVELCPGDAIGHEKQDVRGVLKWVVDTEKCAPYFASHYACALCLRVCPWNARGFSGQYKDSYIQSTKSLRKDWQQLKEELSADLQEPWLLVSEDMRPYQELRAAREASSGKG